MAHLRDFCILEIVHKSCPTCCVLLKPLAIRCWQWRNSGCAYEWIYLKDSKSEYINTCIYIYALLCLWWLLCIFLARYCTCSIVFKGFHLSDCTLFGVSCQFIFFWDIPRVASGILIATWWFGCLDDVTQVEQWTFCNRLPSGYST